MAEPVSDRASPLSDPGGDGHRVRAAMAASRDAALRGIPGGPSAGPLVGPGAPDREWELGPEDAPILVESGPGGLRISGEARLGADLRGARLAAALLAVLQAYADDLAAAPLPPRESDPIPAPGPVEFRDPFA